MWNKSVAWIVLALVSLGAITVMASHFETAFPVVALDLEVDRSRVLESARGRAERGGWGLDGY
ncbi:MAG: hypothetical protein GWM92_14045, partial [Gemmatimonadetes bacterium]|nr:hypothetical protein [Gemmatimonadota bacterium]NIR79848.1 hypothetical protein [Gemmatimonadota bacterium]NIT88568.1 hypothetical protein [Gemmatimonadota bacterium]NIU32388.1 hypothetical protein [Gemmatimonadota bacterium]NIU36888.1 hypothetical protein [Gemmatimonadota bacterium]